jgi:hypothetical protein
VPTDAFVLPVYHPDSFSLEWPELQHFKISTGQIITIAGVFRL